jgi:hypothetical protein
MNVKSKFLHREKLQNRQYSKILDERSARFKYASFERGQMQLTY